MIEKWTTPIPKLSGREGRTVYVYVPDEAQENPEARYPVLYMFDGHNVFFDSDATYGKCWGMKEYLESTNTPLIVVAVDCNHSPNNGRLSEYSPSRLKTRSSATSAGAGARRWTGSRIR